MGRQSEHQRCDAEQRGRDGLSLFPGAGFGSSGAVGGLASRDKKPSAGAAGRKAGAL